MTFTNHATVAAPRNGTNSHTVSPDGTGGTVIAGQAFTPQANRLLICVVEGPVTSTTPSGWTLPSGGAAVNNTGLYVWHRIAAGNDSVTTTHNGTNYPVVFDFYEFEVGSVFNYAASQPSTAYQNDAGPSITGMPAGTRTLMAAASQLLSQPQTPSFTWAAGIETVDTYVAETVTDGYVYSATYVDNSTDTNWQVGATSTMALTVERLVWAITATTPITMLKNVYIGDGVIDEVFIGTEQIDEIYLGSDLIYG